MRSLGYLTIFAPPLLLVLGRQLGIDWLLPLAFFVGMPLLRPLIGSIDPSKKPDWTARERAFLAWLPRIYALLLPVAFAWVALVVHSAQGIPLEKRMGFAISCLVMCGLASCVAHDLAHRSSVWDRRAAHWISALVGYPFFVFEHWLHHAQPRDVEAANCPRREESVWGYALRRGVVAPRQAINHSGALQQRSRSSHPLDRLFTYVALTAAVWLALSAAGGWFGFLLFGGLVVGVPFLLNTITYIQHWGLGTDGPEQVRELRQLGWDETARLQTWLILGISLHHEHHEDPSKAYYDYAPTPSAPRLPAEYAVMVLACFVPVLWRRVMTPMLDDWASRVAKDVQALQN